MITKIPFRRRAGFTMVELLVVIAIIAVLAALTTAAIFQVADNQRIATTESTMRAVHKVLAAQWQAVIDQADREDIPDGVSQMARDKSGTDSPARARVIWKCLRLRQEFPMTVAEASVDLVVGTSTVSAKKIYADQLGGASGKWYVENSTCLLLTLQQNRGGHTLAPDSIPASIIPNGINGLKQLADGYGNPMVFFRSPTGFPELDAKNPAKANSRGSKFRNPLDPEGLLMDKAWNYDGGPQVSAFEASLFMVHTGSGAAYTPISTYMVPTLVSAGKNAKYGFSVPAPYPPAAGTDWDPPPMAGVPPVLDWSMTVPVHGNMDPRGAIYNDPNGYAVINSNDNIYSFRLGIDKRGD